MHDPIVHPSLFRRLGTLAFLCVLTAARAQNSGTATSPTIGGVVSGANITVTQNLTGNTTGGGVTANTTAGDTDWRGLQQMAAAAEQRSNPGQEKTDAQLKQEKSVKVQQARLVEQGARDFYSRYPGSSRIRVARKMEALFALNGVDDDDRAQETAALKTATDYRADKFNHPRDRFEVAELAERVATRNVRGGQLFAKQTDEDIKIAGKLRAEFGDIPEVFRFYASVARSAEMKAATQLARMIIVSGAPSDTKAEAAAILTRQLLVGRRLTSSVNGLDGKIINLEKLAGSPTVICVWSATNPGTIEALAKVPPGQIANFQVLYFAPGATAEQLKALKATSSVPGTLCYQPIEAKRRLTDELRVQVMPYVFVLDDTGVVVGYGPADQAAALIALARK